MATERVGIEVEVLGYDEAKKQMETIDRAVKSFRGKNATIKLSSGEVTTVAKRIKDLKMNIEALKSERVELLAKGGNKERLRQIRKELQQSRAELGRLQTASRDVGRSLTQTFNSISSKIAHTGSAMQSFGNALTRLSMPMRTLFRGTVFAAGYKMLDLMSSGISGATERADTFKTYEKSLKALGYDASKQFVIGTGESMNALDNLEQSVLGLPTGLDEIVASQKKYLAASGDMEKATKAAIAANNIFLAQGSDQKDQLRGARQMRNLLSGGEMTSARWQSLLESMPLAITEIGKAMRENGDFKGNMDEFRQALLGGDIDQNTFLDTLLEVGTSGRIRDAVNEMKHTYGAVTANISNAFRRMGENVLKTMDEVLLSTTGKDTIDWLLSFKGTIDQLSLGIQNWIRANPEVLTNFLDTLKGFDWGGLLTGIGEGLVWSLERLEQALRLFGKLDARAVGRFLGKSGILGQMFTIGGGLLKGSRHPLAFIGTAVSALVQALGGLGGSKVSKGLTTVGRVGSMGDTFAAGIRGLVGAVQVAGTIVIGAGTAMVTMKMFKSTIKDIGEISSIASEIDWDTGKKAITAMAGFLGAFALFGSAAGAVPEASAFVISGELLLGGILTLGAEIAKLTTGSLKTAFSNFKSITQSLNDSLDNIANIKAVSIDKASIQSAFEALAFVYDSMKPQYQGTGIQNMSAREAKRMATVTDGLKAMLKTLRTSAEMLTDIPVIPDAESVKASLRDIVTTMDAVYQDVGKYTPADTSSSENLKKTLGNIANTVSTIKGSVDNLQALGEAKVKIGKAQKNLIAVRDALVDFYTTTQGLFDEYIAGGSEFSVGRNGVGTHKVEDTANVLAIFQNLRDVITTIKSAYEGIMGEEEGFSWDSKGISVKLDELDKIVRYVSDWYEGLDFPQYLFEESDKFAANITGVVSAVQELQRLMTEITTLAGMKTTDDLSGLTSAIDALAPQLEELGAKLQEMGQTFTTNMEESFDFSGVESAVSAGLNGVLSTADGFKGKMQAKGRMLGQTFTNSLKASMRVVNVPTTINVHANLGVVSGIQAAGAEVVRIAQQTMGNIHVNATGGVHNTPHSKGGAIYRARGGSAFPGRPSGTDRIPAWLTEGEYVHRRSATKLFGKGFMERVNSLDVEGAVRALQARFGTQIMNTRSTNINNVVNHNNNQKVTLNAYNDSPSRTVRRFGRYVGAM